MSEENGPHFESLLEFLRRERGFDFSGYKRPSLVRRVRGRMQALGIEDFERYVEHLELHADEFAQLFNAVLINVTSFFRDEAAWDFLAKDVLPQLLGAKRPHEEVRIWSAGCATGEEAYSLAITFAEALGVEAFRARVKIYGTDADEPALNVARLGSYARKDLETLDDALVKRYFEATNNRWVFRPDLRRSIIFGRHDIVQDAPISRLDLLVCRNTLMYFTAETQQKILQRFHFALNGVDGGGYLFLGRAELLLGHSALFTPVNLKCRIFAKVPQQGAARTRAPAALADNGNGTVLMRNDRLRELAQEESPVARIVVDADGVLVMANQRARLALGINRKDLGRPLPDLEICYRPAELRPAIDQAYAERRAHTLVNVERRLSNGERQYLDIVVAPLFDEDQVPIGAGITFLDVTRYSRLSEELQRSREEVQTANEELQSSNEELQTTNEELQSSNEELETTNEELQSTNEELETMNEELQSTNEELQTVNEQLRQRTEEMNQLNAFLESVLAGMRAAAVVVNQNLDVLLWNDRAEDLWGMRLDEVQGRSLLNLDIGLPVGQLREIIRPCLSGEQDHQEIVMNAVNRRGKTIQCRITCSPLFSAAKRREGVILLMEEVQA